ncbi:helix-turn-helix domain-containing protein [Sphingobacterium spiritivorum]|uniref:helix-turn-helix domain-containing protein n=1 Tax=Sphingobacterium spiritivorum TaxID=258 RepID=UPI003DA5BCA7
MINLSKISQIIPPGLEDNGVEFYVHNNTIKCLHNGNRYSWGSFPDWIIDVIEQDMARNPAAIKALVEWDISQKEEMIMQYIICRFGGFDNDPDIDSAGNIEYTEYFDCGRRGNCAQEGKLCSTIKVGDDHLTKSEIAVLKKVAKGLPNKMIADELNISEETVSSHNQNIQRKLGISSKPEMVAFAIKKNITEL